MGAIVTHDQAIDVPRSVWSWATSAYDDATCMDIWRLAAIRQRFRQKLRGTTFRAGLLGGVLIGTAPAAVRGDNPFVVIPTCLVLVALVAYLIVGAINLMHIGSEARTICGQDPGKWLRILDTLDPLTRAHRKSDPVVSVLVSFPCPDAT